MSTQQDIERAKALVLLLSETGPYTIDHLDRGDVSTEIVKLAQDYWSRHEEDTTHLL